MIQRLDEKLINKIAAGEVIERPVNVVKELVENAVDAGAQQITIEVSQECIRVIDDGCGMSKEDLQMSIFRYATSKITAFEDLERVSTLGFRGEALASIASVSSLTILTKEEGELEGWQLHIEGNVVKDLRPCACPRGTIVEVRDLFFNTPVRKKFLDAQEDERIVAFLEKFALGISLVLRLKLHGTLALAVSSHELKDRLVQVYSIDVANEMLPVDFTTSDIAVYGFVSQPSLVRKDKSMQVFFVNGRLVESEEISTGLYEAYKSLLFVNKHPVAVLHLTMEGIDVNVHPTKKIVKFSSPEKVTAAVFEAVRSVFVTEPLEFSPPQTTLAKVVDKLQQIFPFKIGEERQTDHEFQEALVAGNVPEKRLTHFPEMRLLGSIAKTFFIAETEEGVVIIDQHVVEERINYEKFMKQFMAQNVAVQDLLRPELVDFSAKEAMVIRRNIDRLRGYGFFVEEFGEDTFRLTKVPVLFSHGKGVELLRDLIIDFKEDEKEDIITMMSCRRAIKAGDTVSIPEMYTLLKELDKCELPYTCPHGRPIMIKILFSDLEKMFRRKGF